MYLACLHVRGITKRRVQVPERYVVDLSMLQCAVLYLRFACRLYVRSHTHTNLCMNGGLEVRLRGTGDVLH